jgi:GNAT superfamily N-acetyltransferase
MDGKVAIVFAAVDPAADADAAVLIAELTADLGARYTADEVKDLPHYDPSGFDPATGVFLIGYQDDRPVCCGAVRPPGEVKRMYVRPEARGRGLGRLVLAELEARARTLGYRELLLETGIRQTEAIGLYEAAGYEPCPCWAPYDRSTVSRCYRKPL